MFIIWGTKHKTKDVGMVVDRCESCRDTRIFLVTDHYEAGHIYWISLTQGAYKATSRKCNVCGSESICDKSEYDQIVPAADAKELEMADLLTLTNPRLYTIIEQRKDLEAIATVSNPTDGEADGARLQLMLNKLRELEGSDAAHELMTELEAWPTMTAEQRDDIVKQVDDLVVRTEMIQQTVRFIRNMSESFPQDPGCATGLFVFLAPLALFFMPMFQNWPAGIALVVISLIVGVVAYIKVERTRVRNWVHKQLIPKAREQEIEYAVFLGLLSGIDGKDETVDPKIRGMIGQLGEVVKILATEGLIELEQQEEA